MARKRKKVPYEEMTLEQKLMKLKNDTRDDFRKLREKEYAKGKSRKRKDKSKNARIRDVKIRKRNRRNWDD